MAIVIFKYVFTFNVISFNTLNNQTQRVIGYYIVEQDSLGNFPRMCLSSLYAKSLLDFHISFIHIIILYLNDHCIVAGICVSGYATAKLKTYLSKHTLVHHVINTLY